ncbi:MAG: hypothetical protein KDD48_06530 [Bdellovibrionales bacterium]|nr:hypothetical protein [Bdellovibrionales bacterium]
MKRALQLFSTDYLKQCSTMKAEEILQFLEDFRTLHGFSSTKKTLISLRISESLLATAKIKAKAAGIPYQTQIQRLIQDWVKA